jgi:hypothetical protein
MALPPDERGRFSKDETHYNDGSATGCEGKVFKGVAEI